MGSVEFWNSFGLGPYYKHALNSCHHLALGTSMIFLIMALAKIM
jgi:hypothetical protein